MQTPDWNTTNDNYNESIGSMLSLYGIAVSLIYLRVQKSVIIMTTSCPRHNNVVQFLEVSKNCQVIWLESSTFWKKSYFNFALHVYFLWKNLRGRYYLKIIGVGREVALGARALSIEMPPMTKIQQKSFLSSFSVSFRIFSLNSTRIQQ